MEIVARHLSHPANLLSLLRLAMAIPVTWIVAHPDAGLDWLLLTLVIAAAITDWADGFLSRKLGQVSDLGRVLDPLADKAIIVAGILTAVFYRGFPALVVLLQAYRDVMIVIGGTVIARRTGTIISASIWGKLNTFLISALCLAFVIDPNSIETQLAAHAVLGSIFISGASYYRRGEVLLVKQVSRRLLWRAGFFLPPIVLWWVIRSMAPGLRWL